MKSDLDRLALEYHRADPPGKLGIVATKPMATQHDLSLAYSPGVAAACTAIEQNASDASQYTARGNLVGVVSNGTAVLGLGAIGALASKPVMEGKAVLFKKFSGVDVFDIEIEERDPDKFIEIVAGLEATFGGINLEDIKAPECFYIEQTLRERMSIPVFHDDQHGTAIVTAAAVTSALKVVGRDISDVSLVASGAGAAAVACLDLLVNMGLKKDSITVLDSRGVIYTGREERMDEHKARYARDTDQRTMDDAIGDADIFLGCSGPGSLTTDQVATMSERPIILALANPVPEIMPEEAKKARPNAIIATGRSDYPNQVNNVLCFPFIFRGALDVGATTINEQMKIACVNALSELAMAEPSDVVKRAYSESLRFGPEYLIPKPFDPRLITEVASAVAKAAMESGVATHPIADFRQYRRHLSQFVFKSSGLMDPIFERARDKQMRVCFAEGEDERVLQAAQQVVDGNLARPILIGREQTIKDKIAELGLRLEPGVNVSLAHPSTDPNFERYWREYAELMGRSGVSLVRAQRMVSSRSSVYASLILRCGDADAMLCGAVGPFKQHLERIDNIIGRAPGVRDYSTLVGLILEKDVYFICDTHVTPDPSAEEIAEMTLLSAAEVRRFGVVPKVALLSHSNFGSSITDSARKMKRAVAQLRERAPDLEVDGEMHAEAALSEAVRNNALPGSMLKGKANLLVMPNIDSAHIAFSLLKTAASGVAIGPILVGAAKPVHVVTQAITVRGLVNMTAIAAVQASLD